MKTFIILSLITIYSVVSLNTNMRKGSIVESGIEAPESKQVQEQAGKQVQEQAGKQVQEQAGKQVQEPAKQVQEPAKQVQ